MMPVGMMASGKVPPAPPLAATRTGTYNSSSGGGLFTFTNLSLGDSTFDRSLLFVACIRISNGGQANPVTLGEVPVDAVVQVTPHAAVVIGHAFLPKGTTPSPASLSLKYPMNNWEGWAVSYVAPGRAEIVRSAAVQNNTNPNLSFDSSGCDLFLVGSSLSLASGNALTGVPTDVERHSGSALSAVVSHVPDPSGGSYPISSTPGTWASILAVGFKSK